MEHLHHFGLGQDPFSNEPDLRFYFESQSHRDAQLRVERGLRQHKGLTILTGDGGMGKTLLARRILEALEEEVFEATLLVMLPGSADATSILQRFARQLGVDDPKQERAGLIGQIYEQLAVVREDGRHAVLIVDDAQIMTPEVLSELGGLLSLEYEDRRLLSLLLIGSPGLDAQIRNDPDMAPRVEVRVPLRPLAPDNATAYIQHRLRHVGGDLGLIPAEALDALHKFGRGRPRLLNTLADNALFEAYLAGRTAIDASDVERAAVDLGVAGDPGIGAGAAGRDARPPGSKAAPAVVSTTRISTPDDVSMSLGRRQTDDILELSSAMIEPPSGFGSASGDLEIESLSFDSRLSGSDPLEMALDDAEFSTDDVGDLEEGVFVELIQE